MIKSSSRRTALGRIGGSIAMLAASGISTSAVATAGPQSSISGALARLTQQLAQIPRKRQFKQVPFMLTHPLDWDERAAGLILAYSYRSKQVWENSEIGAAWPNLMREAINAQQFAHRHPDFLAVSATHGLAHLALFSEDAWRRYHLNQLAGPAFPTNILIQEKAGATMADDRQNVDGFYGPGNNNIVSLQRRGAIFIACHDSIHAIARRIRQDAGPSAAPVAEIAADLTNSLIPDCVLVPSVVGFLVELEQAGFCYAKGS